MYQFKFNIFKIVYNILILTVIDLLLQIGLRSLDDVFNINVSNYCVIKSKY